MYVSFKTTQQILTEERSDVDISTINQKFTYYPKGIIIQDTYNNPMYPITPTPKIDTAKLDLKEVFTRFTELYGFRKGTFLPWHYCIEFFENSYYVFNTRPINIKYPLKNSDFSNNTTLDPSTKKFIDANTFDVSDMLHVCVVGDTFSDTYTKQFYEVIGKCCIKPFVMYFKLPGIFQRVNFFNIGKRFNINYLERFSML